jgi:hypothetical protein
LHVPFGSERGALSGKFVYCHGTLLLQASAKDDYTPGASPAMKSLMISKNKSQIMAHFYKALL